LQACPPSGPPAPLLAVRAVLPEGATVTASPGSAGAKDHVNGAVFGFRPGYSYRLKFASLPGYPGEVQYGELEVRGSIIPRPGMKYMEYAAPLFITKEDINRVFVSGLVTKVIYLEDPNKAQPFETTPDRPIELPAVGEREAFRDAELNGRIVAVLRLGDRIPDAEELARYSIDGTVLQPGENRLTQPLIPPPHECSGIPLYDPILGPKANKEECFTNGGDSGPRVGFSFDGKVGGRNPTDVTAEYTTGPNRKVTTSNTVCICSPRFVLQRAEVVPFGFQSRTLVGNANQYTKQNVFSQREKSIAASSREKSLSAESRLRPGSTIAQTALHAIAAKTRPQVAYRIDGIRAIGTVSEPDELTTVPEGLVITKEVEPAGPAQPGDVLTITIRYSNNGRQPITDVVISDSLSGRLEYVRGSAASDRPSNVTTQPNEAGSVTVQVEIPGPIPPATRGLIRFQIRVR